LAQKNIPFDKPEKGVLSVMCLLPYCTSLLFYALKLLTDKGLSNIFCYFDGKIIKAFILDKFWV
jgi:hypothetical protein